MPRYQPLTQTEREAIYGAAAANASVPAGHRAKCRKCGAVDNVKLQGQRRLRRCGACGSTLALRRAPRKPKIVSYVVCRQLNGEDYGDVPCVDQFQAEREAISFTESGPVARVRVAQIVELLDGDRTGNVRTLRYDNFRQRRGVTSWVGGCSECKGRGLIPAVVRPATAEAKAVIKFLSCGACSGLGGELTRKVMFPHKRRHK